MRIQLDDVLRIPYDKAEEAIIDFIRDKVSESGVNGAVLGLSGGIDSSVTLELTVRALGSERVVALIMPDTRTTPQRDIVDAISLAEKHRVRHYLIEIDRIVDAYSVVPFYKLEEKIPTGNLRARIRMNILYYYANLKNMIVIGTGDRSEILIGYFTKYGDGGVDLLPIGSLYKTQVRKMGEYLGLPESIVKKPSSPALWPGHSAEQELGIKYETIDLVLYSIFDRGIAPDDVPRYTGVGVEIVRKILEMHRKTRHKRKIPDIARLPWIKEPIREI